MQQNSTLKQEYSTSTELYKVLALSLDIDVQIFNQVFEILLKKDLTQDSYQFLSSDTIHQHFTNYGKQLQLEFLGNNIKKLSNLIKVMKEHDFNKINYSSEIYEETRKQLIQKIKKDIRITEYLKFSVHLSVLDEAFIQSSSNSLMLLVQMKVDLTEQCWQNIRIKNTSLMGANFAKCDLSGSDFENIKMNGVNLNRALLFDCKWRNIILGQVQQLKGHYDMINQVGFASDGVTIASVSDDENIIVWNLKSGKSKLKLKLKNQVKSLCFSSDLATLASGIRIWEVGKKELEQQLNEYNDGANSELQGLNCRNLLKSNYQQYLKAHEQLKNFDINPIVTTVLITKQLIFQACGALVYGGEFCNHLGMNLKPLLESKGSIFLDKLLK